MSLALSKTLDPADYLDLAGELVVVDQHFAKEREQHPARRWEYALALRSLATWTATQITGPVTIADVGGAGSPFRHMLVAQGLRQPEIIDPDGGEALVDYLTIPRFTDYDESHPMLQQVVFCLSVLEHVPDLPQFLYHLSCLVAPGGLLFLTMDCCGSPHARPIDTAHFHWMRQRIFSVIGVTNDVTLPLLSRDFAFLGEHEHTYGGDQLYGSYSFASLALVKRS